MSDATKLVAEKRTDFGKGAARKIRRAGNIPAVMYGHGTAPVHISLPGHDTLQALKHTNALLTIVVDGKEQLALAKDVQRDPLKQTIDHIDLIAVRRGEKVQVDVTINLVGQSPPDVLLQLESQTVLVEADATNIPSALDVDINELAVGQTIAASDLQLPDGVTLAVDPEIAVIVGLAAPTADQMEAEIAEVEAELGAGQTGEAAAEAVEAPGEPTGEGDVVPGTAENSGGPSEDASKGADE